MLSFNDAFYLLSILLILIVPLVLFMKRSRDASQTTGMH
jgi:hypothetical protein